MRQHSLDACIQFMGDPVTINLRHVARGLGISLEQCQAVVELLDEGNTVPFITRYRKDRSGGLDEEQIRQIQSRLIKMRLLAERKQTVLRSIESQGKLTERLAKQIRAAGTTKRLEDLYLPYKPKKQTLATVARIRGLEPLAQEILAADAACADLDNRAADFANPDRQVPTPADALLGAGHILAEQFSENAELRQRLREILQRTGRLVSNRIGGPPEPTAEPADNKPRPPAEKPDAQSPAEPETPDSTTAKADSQTEPAPEQTSPAEPTDSQTGGSADAVTEAEKTPEPLPEPTADTEPTEPSAVAETTEPSAVAEPTEPSAVADTEEPSVDAEPVEQPSTDTTDADTTDADTTDADAPVAEEPEADAPPLENPGSQEPADDETGVKSDVEQPPQESAQKPAESADAKPKPVAVKPAPKAPPKQNKAERRLSKKELRKQKAEEKKQKAFSDYFDYREEIKKIPPHRVLAINRGERARVLRVKVEADTEAMLAAVDELCVPNEHPQADFLRGCARDALARLIVPSLEREIRRELTDRAETHAVGVFAKNLRNLLLQPPIHDRRVLAVDPGFKSGCKLVALDQFGNVLAHDVIYLIGDPARRKKARKIVGELVDRFGLTVAAIGNGTACRETEDFFADLISTDLKDKGLAYVIVNEAGASVYSTSQLGREEFPDYDATLRGAISIGRRLQDPLSELVKIDAASIGVGLYQHDVKAKHLRTSLDEVVESCVNYVGVDANTASPALLRYVSGLNQLTARRLYEHRLQNGPFRSREQLKGVTGFGDATFVQAAGFLKITSGENPLDATWIHPESYELAGRVMARLESAPADLADREASAEKSEKPAAQRATEMAGEFQVGELLLSDILAQLARPGRDPREDLPAPVFKQGIIKLEDLTAGMELTGTVLNVVDFGAFVDIGMHDSGLVHVSHLADKFIRDPHDVIAVGDIVKVWVVEVDKERRRVSLTMIPPGTKRSTPRRHEKSETKPPEGRDRQSRPPRKPRGKGGPPRDRDRRPPRQQYKPTRPPKPVTPLTNEMKTGRAPMRSFSDLAQFFKPEEAPKTDDAKEAKGKRKKKKPKKTPPVEAEGEKDGQPNKAVEQPSQTAEQPSPETPPPIAPEQPPAAEAPPAEEPKDQSQTTDQ